MSPDIPSYRVRFEGIQAGELSKLNVYPGEVAIINPNSDGAKALKYTSDSLIGKVFVLRINPNDPSIILSADDVEAGSPLNRPVVNGSNNYAVARKADNYANSTDRYMASVFYRTDQEQEKSIINKIRSIFLKIPTATTDVIEYVKNKTKEYLSPDSVIETRFEEILTAILNEQAKMNDYLYFNTTDINDPLGQLADQQKVMFDALVAILILQEVYSTASEWPYIGWDEYYPDGSPVTLNWELIIAGLARVYTETLNFIKGPALIDPSKAISIGREINK